MFAQVVIDGYMHVAYAGVTVRPPQIDLSALSSTVIHGDSMSFRATANPSSAPLQITGWRFTPDDTSRHGTEPCGASNLCADLGHHSGTMRVHGTVANRTDTASVHVTVTDSVVAKCRAANPDTMRLTVVRAAEDILCIFRVASGRPFTVERADAVGVSVTPITLTPSPDSRVWTTQGLAVASTTVELTVKVSGQSGTIPGEARFDVEPRQNFAQLQLTRDPREARQPIPDATGFTYGMFLWWAVDTTLLAPRTVPSGPNRGLIYLDEVPLAQPWVLLNSVLFDTASTWYRDQNGTTKLPRDTTDSASTHGKHGRRYCMQTDIDSIVGWVRRHEGMTRHPRSHYVLTQEQLISGNESAPFESMIFVAGSKRTFIIDVINQRLRKIKDKLGAAQRTSLDEPDRAAFEGDIGCAVDYDARNQ
jgi:hypothetical protein